MSQQANFIAKAQGEVGTKENPPNSNNTKYGEFTGKNGLPWCGSFVMWCANQVGLKMPSVVYTPAGVIGFQGIGAWANPQTSTPQPGFIAFFDFPGGKATDHVGIVIKDNGDGTVTTVEGNTIPDGKTGNEANGGEVCLKIRAYRKDNKRKLTPFITGFGKPKFKD